MIVKKYRRDILIETEEYSWHNININQKNKQVNINLKEVGN